MKYKIGALIIAMGLALATTALAYPTTDTAGDNQASQNGKPQIEKVKMNELPQSVQTTINQHLEGGNVKHIERISENGQMFYKISLKNANGDKQQFRVDSNGQYLGPQTEQQNMNQTTPNSTTPTSGGVRPSQQER